MSGIHLIPSEQWLEWFVGCIGLIYNWFKVRLSALSRLIGWSHLSFNNNINIFDITIEMCIGFTDLKAGILLDGNAQPSIKRNSQIWNMLLFLLCSFHPTTWLKAFQRTGSKHYSPVVSSLTASKSFLTQHLIIGIKNGGLILIPAKTYNGVVKRWIECMEDLTWRG